MVSTESFLPEVQTQYGDYFYKAAKEAIAAGQQADDETLLTSIEEMYQEMMEQSDGGYHSPNG